MRVALVVMPFASANRPSLAAGLLKASLTGRGIACDVLYPSLDFARELGLPRYQLLAEGILNTTLAGEWVFSQAFYGSGFSAWDTYEAEVLKDPEWGTRVEHHPAVREAADLVPGFLTRTLETVDWKSYDLVGFTSTFQQTLASLCLARGIRERHPHVLLAAGGANFEAPMGRVYMERFPFLDYVANGEGDLSFPALCENLRDGRAEVPAGILFRQGDRVLPREDTRSEFVEMDRLPCPDFSEFFAAFEEAFPPPRPCVYLSVEASRGCWWGQVSHCTFCGLNGETMAYRRKSGTRVAMEVEGLLKEHPGARLMFADNIMDMKVFRDLLPRWASTRDGTPKFFEVKPNLARSQLALLAEAGVIEVQAGIESLADGTLRVMSKGGTAAQNVAFLRWCEEFQVGAHWNIIFGSPNEDLADYGESFRLAEKLTHLRPPAGVFRIRLDRYSPNHRDWSAQGFLAIRPLTAYRHIYPFPEDEMARIAYFFEYDHPRAGAVREASKPLFDLVGRWRAHEAGREKATLAVRRHLDGSWVLVDRRFNRPASLERLDLVHLAFLLACDAPTSLEKAREKVARGFPDASTMEREAALNLLLEKEAITEAGASIVTLALLPFDLRAGEASRFQSERTVFHGRRDSSILVSS